VLFKPFNSLVVRSLFPFEIGKYCVEMLFTMIASLFSALIHWRGCFLQVMNCPNMSELSLCFTEHSSDCTNLITLMDGLGRTCPNLEKMHISSKQLSNEAVCALENANLRYLSALLFPLQPSF
jgi:hypothetical protein